MEIYTNTDEPARVTALLSHSPKAVEEGLGLEKPNAHAGLGREMCFSVGKGQLLCCEQWTALFVFGWCRPRCAGPPLVHPATH